MRNRLGEIEKEYCCLNVICAAYWLQVHTSSPYVLCGSDFTRRWEGLRRVCSRCWQARGLVQGMLAATLSHKSLTAFATRLGHWRSPALRSSPTQHWRPMTLLERMSIMNGMRMLGSEHTKSRIKEPGRGSFSSSLFHSLTCEKTRQGENMV